MHSEMYSLEIVEIRDLNIFATICEVDLRVIYESIFVQACFWETCMQTNLGCADSHGDKGAII
jgi:hypothetical protein